MKKNMMREERAWETELKMMTARNQDGLYPIDMINKFIKKDVFFESLSDDESASESSDSEEIQEE